MKRKGFTLIEMLVVIGILAILMGAGLASFSSATKKAQKAKAQELVTQVATALEAIYQKEGCWPRRITAAASSDAEFTPELAYELAKRGAMSLTYDDTQKRTTGADSCGIVSPWAQQTIKRVGTGFSEGTHVSTGGTIRDHRLHFAIDTEGKGLVKANVGGQAVTVRSTAVVWCCGYDGKIERYSEGLRSDDVYSWSKMQIKD